MNNIADHPLTRRDVLEHIRSIRRTIKRAQAAMVESGDHLLTKRPAEQLAAAIRRCDDAKRALTKARPRRRTKT